ncbi:hypothetical protein SAMN05216378_2334 [Paenibacillus catalpae]|uniref:Tissue inhibitor of metalloproteinase n=1 Tax=Paenibacillus catalpae TaxID=1045775 RepID=A0A1I1XT10_9BACL|nr:hypothetical protein [Paenibacillus catalpae]SFE10462.1 hypothetical protein SAMN05216378_2334 [Paenibacillus catalpae]
MWKITSRFFLIYLVVFGTWFMFEHETVHACSCAAPPNIEDQLNLKTAIFTGKVVSLTQPVKGKLMSTADPVKVQFEVKTVWKGELSSQTTVYTAMSSESCGYEEFDVDEEFIVFAYGDPDHLETGICEGNKTIAAAQEDLKALGAGYEPAKITLHQKDSSDITSNNKEFNSSLVIAPAVFLSLLILLAITLKRRGR